jgi:hypothetical protein
MPGTKPFPSHFISMDRDGDDLREIEEMVRLAQALANAQEAEIRRMREAGLDVSRAEALLLAYREALRIAADRHRALLERSEHPPAVQSGNISKR